MESEVEEAEVAHAPVEIADKVQGPTFKEITSEKLTEFKEQDETKHIDFKGCKIFKIPQVLRYIR